MAYKRKIRVLHLMGSLQPSGMERMFVSGSFYFKEAAVESVIVGQGESHPYAGELARAGYQVEQIPPVGTISGLLAFRRLIRKLAPDIVHIHTEGAFAFSVLATAGKDRRWRVVRTVHNVFGGNTRARISRKIQAWLVDRFVSVFIVPSPDVQANEEVLGRRSQLIYNWVDDRFIDLRKEREHQVRDDERVSLIMVGNASPIKNQELVLRVIQDLPIDLYYHGDETKATDTERRLLDQLQAQGRLLHRGVSDPASSLLAATLFVMPSKQEGMPVSLAEALTAGVPALVSDAPGLRWASHLTSVEVVSGQAEAWAEALGRVVAMPAQIESKCADTFNFSAARGVDEYVELYRKLRPNLAFRESSDNK